MNKWASSLFAIGIMFLSFSNKGLACSLVVGYSYSNNHEKKHTYLARVERFVLDDDALGLYKSEARILAKSRLIEVMKKAGYLFESRGGMTTKIVCFDQSWVYAIAELDEDKIRKAKNLQDQLNESFKQNPSTYMQ